jgi:hypothetical protein
MTRRRIPVASAAAALATVGSLALVGGAAARRTAPANLGNGLSRLVQRCARRPRRST